MAKGKKDKAKIRFVLGEIEGDNETIREALRSISDAVTRTFQPDVRIVKVIGTDGSGIDQGKLLTQAEEQTIIDMDLEDEQKEDSDEKSNKPGRKKQSKSRSFSPPDMLDLDLTSGDLPFEDFCNQKNPQSHLQKYLVIAYWLKSHRGIEAIGVQHIYTVYKVMKWNTVNDLDSVFRNSLKPNAGQEFMRVNTGEYRLTIAGENAVRKMGS